MLKHVHVLCLCFLYTAIIGWYNSLLSLQLCSCVAVELWSCGAVELSKLQFQPYELLA